MSRKLKVLELFAGTRSISKEFEKRGHEVFTIEWDEVHDNIDWYTDVNEVTAQDILDKFGQPDVIWISMDCKSYSIAGITHHRRKQEDGSLKPISDYAKFCDKTNKYVLDEIVAKLNPLYYFIENPRAGLRKMDFMQDIPRHTTTYCSYGHPNMKPTDLFTNHPNPQFAEPCKNGAPCHARAPRGSTTGTQGMKNAIVKSMIPEQLCQHVVKVCEEGAFKPWEEMNIAELEHRKEYLSKQIHNGEYNNDFTLMEISELDKLISKLTSDNKED